MPLPVRLVALLNLPVFLAIFVIEKRKRLLWMIAVLYFGVAGLYLATGSRGGTLTMALVLWYLARIKSSKRTRVLVPVLLAAILICVAVVVDATRRARRGVQNYLLGPLEFIAQQGISLNVTEVAIKYKDLFRPHIASYLFHDLWLVFVPSDISRYVRGRVLKLGHGGVSESKPRQNGFWYWRIIPGGDVSIGGAGWRRGVVASARIWPEPYLCLRQQCVGLIVVALILPDFLLMPRGDNLAWLSTLMRNAILFCPLLAGWWLFSLLSSLRGPSPRTLPPAPYGPANA